MAGLQGASFRRSTSKTQTAVAAGLCGLSLSWYGTHVAEHTLRSPSYIPSQRRFCPLCFPGSNRSQTSNTLLGRAWFPRDNSAGSVGSVRVNKQQRSRIIVTRLLSQNFVQILSCCHPHVRTPVCASSSANSNSNSGHSARGSRGTPPVSHPTFLRPARPWKSAWTRPSCPPPWGPWRCGGRPSRPCLALWR